MVTKCLIYVSIKNNKKLTKIKAIKLKNVIYNYNDKRLLYL